MKLDIYRRPEPAHKLSFMAVPAGQMIPQEVTNVDWRVVANNLELDAEADCITEYQLEHPGRQIREKGYAITSVQHQLEASD